MGGRAGGAGEGGPRARAYVAIHIADSLCAAETNTHCKSNDTPIKKIKTKLMPRKAPSALTLEEKQPSVDFLTQMSHPVSCLPKGF